MKDQELIEMFEAFACGAWVNHYGVPAKKHWNIVKWQMMHSASALAIFSVGIYVKLSDDLNFLTDIARIRESMEPLE